MDRDNKAATRKVGRRKKRENPPRAAPHLGTLPPAAAAWAAGRHGGPQPENEGDTQGLPALHLACLYGQLAAIERLVDSGPDVVNSSCPRGRRPIHMLLSHRSYPNTVTCLTHLLQHGANVNVTADSGQTALHLAASEGLLDCTEILVQAGADVLAQDDMGHTPLDMARVWCHRKVARYLKSCMWEANKKKEMEQRRLVQHLYSDLLGEAEANDQRRRVALNDEEMAEWARSKGLNAPRDPSHLSPCGLVSQYHAHCLPGQDGSKPGGPSRLPPLQRPWEVYTGCRPGSPPRPPDLRHSVRLWTEGAGQSPRYATAWDGAPRLAPDLPIDVLQRVLFPADYPSRIACPKDFEPRGILDTQSKGSPQGHSASPWTEVAMHLAEVLEPGHY